TLLAKAGVTTGSATAPSAPLIRWRRSTLTESFKASCISCLQSMRRPPYFHAATAYEIVRSFGVPVGKRDFFGM
ncbi:MAG: DUF1993 family protein, partial [Methyloceanibacter sp.]